MKVYYRAGKRNCPNIEIARINIRELGINLTDDVSGKTAWVGFPLEQARKIRSLIDKTIRNIEEKKCF